MEAIAAKERKTEPRRELTDYAKEQLNQTLSALCKGQQITVIYYSDTDQAYIQITGVVVKIDPYWKVLTINQYDIDFSDLHEIVG